MDTVMNSTSYSMDVAPTPMQNLYPALIECFAIIICGYLAGRMNLISETESKGMNTFVGTFSLPSLIFMSLAQLDLTSVNWLFLAAILISKAIVFFSVIIITLLVGRPVNVGRAGIFGIFCTQSNDFAIGYPIVVALYKHTHPDYASYLYLMAPISLAILNPIGFILMEIGKRKKIIEDNPMRIDFNNSSVSVHKEKLKVVISVVKEIISNPIIFMTILGILGNLIFSHNVPKYLGGILEVLGSAFSASALFLLGLRMVGKIHTLKGSTLIVPGIIIAVKLLVLPLVTREVVSVLHVGKTANDTLDLSTYGFLYGTFPSAPTVFVFATQYSLDVDLIASAMVACTFLSAPLMFISAKMITLTNTDPTHYITELDSFAFDISVGSIIACIWMLLTFTITKKIKNIPHRITICLVISQLLSCIGVIMWSTIETKQDWIGFMEFMIFTVGVYSTRIWTAFLAVSLVFMQCRSLCYVIKLQPYFIIFGYGIPIVISTLLLLCDKQNLIPNEKKNPNFQYGMAQELIAVCLLILCFIVTVGCLILHQRYKKRYTQYMNMANEVATTSIQNDLSSDNESSEESVITNASPTRPTVLCGNLPTISEGCCEETQSPMVDIEDLLSPASPTAACLTRNVCQGPARVQCSGLRQRYEDQINTDVDVEEEPVNYDPQITRHIILLIFLLCSMFVGLSLSIWTLIMDEMTGIYIELAFLDATLNFGQSLIVFAIFGMDTKELLIPLLKVWRKVWYGADMLILPRTDELGFETKHVCDQFVTHHLENCKKAIGKDTRWRLTIYKNAFTGMKFIDWLIEIGLAHDRVEAVHYARHLLEGRVIRHINEVHHFYDRNFLYTFV